jgi:5-methylcytosine-specific restriction endonuclease McrA
MEFVMPEYNPDVELPPKECPKCHEIYPRIPEFWSRDNSLVSGLCGTCKNCKNKYRERFRREHPEYESVRRKRYQMTSADKRAAIESRYRDRNREKTLARHHLYFINNKSKFAQQAALYRQRHPERAVAASSRWRRKHLIASRAIAHKRRARELNAPGAFTDTDIKLLYKLQEGTCYYCGVELNGVYHIDHYVALTKGGSNWPTNLRLACQPCNNRKHNKSPHEFIKSILAPSAGQEWGA